MQTKAASLFCSGYLYAQQSWRRAVCRDYFLSFRADRLKFFVALLSQYNAGKSSSGHLEAMAVLRFIAHVAHNLLVRCGDAFLLACKVHAKSLSRVEIRTKTWPTLFTSFLPSPVGPIGAGVDSGLKN